MASRASTFSWLVPIDIGSRPVTVSAEPRRVRDKNYKLFMHHFVYILYSESKDIFYKGESEQPLARLEEHNKNLSRYTSNKGPWKMVYLEECENKTEALRKEKMLKKQNRKYLLWLIEQSTNKLKVNEKPEEVNTYF